MTEQLTVAEIKAGIVAQLGAAIPALDVRPNEPTSWTRGPMLSVLTAGFERAPVASPVLGGGNLQDPIGGRAWLWYFTLRIWVELKADGVVAQDLADVLMKQVVDAWEADQTLGTANSAGVKVVESAIASGRIAKVESPGTRELLMVEMDAAVHVTEPME